MRKFSNIIKEIKKTIQLFNFKKKTIDIKFLKKKNNFFSSPHNFFYINCAILKQLNILKIDDKFTNGGIKFLIDNQNKNGSFDEWYANENSFCASAYTGYYLSNLINKKIKINFKKDIIICLEKLNKYLNNKSNFTNLNQELAKFAFQSKLQKKYNSKYLNLIFKKTLEYENFEYGGLDLGYLSVNLMILSDLLTNRFNNKIFNIFRHQLNIYSTITDNFKNFPNYIFSRSSRIIMLSGFLYAYKKGLISNLNFKNIYKNYILSLKNYRNNKDKKYLSFFFSGDFANIIRVHEVKFEKNNFIKKTNNIPRYKSFIINKDRSISFYLDNSNIFALNFKKNTKYFFDTNLNYLNAKYIPKINKRFNFLGKTIFSKNLFVKVNNFNFLKKNLGLVTYLSKYIALGNFIKSLGKNLLIKHKTVKNIASYKKIRFDKRKLYVEETIIFKKRFIQKFTSLSQDKLQFYFSPTSFINKKELGVVLDYKIKFYVKRKYYIYKINYECS